MSRSMSDSPVLYGLLAGTGASPPSTESKIGCVPLGTFGLYCAKKALRSDCA